MRAKYVPPEFGCFLDDDTPVTVRYDADMGEEQWFDARAGVGSPGYPASICVTEVKIGDGQWTAELDQFDPDWLARIEQNIEETLIEREQDRYEA